MASKAFNLDIAPSEVSSIVQPDTRDDRWALKANWFDVSELNGK